MDEPLEKMARFAHDWADTFCEKAHECRFYHQAWPLVRLIENGGALPDGEDFFIKEINSMPLNHQAHILISGGADSGLMAIALKAASICNLDVRITAVDRCRTPLEQMRLYGAIANVPTDTILCSLEQIPPGLDADVILGHSILYFIPQDLRSSVFHAWSDALKPGGKVLLSNRLSKYTTPRRPSKNANELIEKRTKSLLEKLKRFDNMPLHLSSGEIMNIARELWSNKLTSYNVSKQDIMDAAQGTNLSVKSLTAHNKMISNSAYGFSKYSKVDRRFEIVLEKN